MYCLIKNTSRSLPRFDVFNTALEASVAQHSYVYCYIPHLSVYSLILQRLDVSLLISSVTYFFHQFINQVNYTVRRSCMFQLLGNSAVLFVLRDPMMYANYFNFEK